MGDRSRRLETTAFNLPSRPIARERPLPHGTVLEIQDAQQTPSEFACQHETEAWIRWGLEFLEPEEQRVIVLRTYDGMSHGDIGEQIGNSPDASRMQFNRALDRLAQTVGLLRRGELDQLVPGCNGRDSE